MAVCETGGPLPLAELHWRSSHTKTLEAHLETGRWTRDGLAGRRRAIGQGEMKSDRMYQVDQHLAGQYPAVAEAAAQSAAECLPNLEPCMCMPHKQWIRHATCPVRFTLRRGGGRLRARNTQHTCHRSRAFPGVGDHPYKSVVNHLRYRKVPFHFHCRPPLRFLATRCLSPRSQS